MNLVSTPEFDPHRLLEEHLAERTTVVQHGAPSTAGEFVLYWMRCAVRDHENPALDAAIQCAKKLDRPMLVYHGVSERYPYASDRIHRFILEGARDVAVGLSERGITYACHVERNADRRPHLHSLANRASVVITEDMPTEPMRKWTTSVAASCSVPVLAVDTACVVSPRLYGRFFTRAFKFRKAMKPLLEGRIRSPWREEDPPLTFSGPLPFTPVDIVDCDIGELIADCDIDHSIGAVPHTPGGSTAGYARWRQFRQYGLSSYARRRNNPLIVGGVSRMSAYFHFGHVSPLRIARQLYGTKGQGAEKYLDELLVWRELAYTWCHYHSSHESLSVLPQWAQDTWDKHRHDVRHVQSWESLARAKTGDDLWDACQTSLLQHGELHNNVRMTWGKAVARWSASPEQTLENLIDLNHRYALDGRDPSSYGGLLWCMGLFDREFPPERPVSGVVRPRETEQHAARLDVSEYRRLVSRPLFPSEPKVAVIGAGPAGSLLGRTLSDHGLDVTIFDKGRGLGGRTAARDDRLSPSASTFDFGAQYMSFRNRHLQRRVDSWVQDGVISVWDARFARISNGATERLTPKRSRYVANPTMRGLCEYLVRDQHVRRETRVSAIARDGSHWRLSTEKGDLGAYDIVLVTAPAPQTARLLERVAPELSSAASASSYSPCWAVMAYASSSDVDYDAAVIEDHPLSWVARDDSKPNRPKGVRWVLHASPTWSREHLEDDREAVCDTLLSAARTLGIHHITDAYAHRWRFALVDRPTLEPSTYDANLAIGFAGDWCRGARVEAAMESALHLAGYCQET